MIRLFQLGCVCSVLALTGCSVAGAAAGAAISVGGAVVSTGVVLTGKAIGAGFDAMSSKPESADNSGIVVRERISDAPRPCRPDVGDTVSQTPCT
ncbi:hypothetical protein [Ottowia thiooxydans]|uniref:hypothetical protein n=1 Tax=Ottowia thiooxydans TaxID=219182 RepID=UPI000563E111|nr:hypothetical protein [Ottowia thiooxydans]